MSSLTKTQIKNYGLAIAVVLVILLGTCSIYLASKNKSTREDLALERSKYGLLKAEKYRLDSEALEMLEVIKERNLIIEELRTKYSWRMAEVRKLKDSLAVKNAEIDALSADSSFKYINIVYPAIADKVYPLDSLQIKTFHKVDVGYKGEFEVNKSLSSAMQDLKNISDGYFLQSENYKTLYLDRKTYAELMTLENTVLTKEVKMLNKKVDRQRKSKTVSQGGLVVALGAIVVLLIL